VELEVLRATSEPNDARRCGNDDVDLDAAGTVAFQMESLTMRISTRMKLALAFAGLLVTAPALRAQQGGYRVIVNAANPVSSLEVREVSRMFRKEVTRWKDGSTVAPVDQRTQAPARAAFSQKVHGRSVQMIAEFWRQQIFSGRNVPPVEKASDVEVLEYVRSNPGAIGYVSSTASLAPNVKVVTVNGG
jgi:ABC-type phosphate transport system substrate-binding protein